MWTAISYVSSGITLLAFIAAVAAWVYWNKLVQQRKLIEAAAEEDRRDLVLAALEFFHVDTGNLTKQQRFELAVQQIRNRANRFLVTAILIAILALIAAVVAISSLGKDAPKATFAIVDGETLDPVHRELSVRYRLQETGHEYTVNAAGGICTIEGIEEAQIETINASCGGYDYCGTSEASPTRIRLCRNDAFLRQIIPGDPLWQGDLPTNDEYTEITNTERLPDEVTLTCVNNTDRFVDVLLFHYVPNDPDEFGLGWTPICRCSPNGKATFSEFGQRPGYFLVFVSTYGMPAKYATKGHLYRTDQPKLTLDLAPHGEIVAKLTL